jgi:hypothetical protein
MQEKHHHSYRSRIELNENLLNKFFNKIYTGKVSELSLDKGLSYTLVYNLVYGRIRSLSARDFKIIFGEDPPFQEIGRVDGKYFRGMVKLWVYLNGAVTESDLYREFYPQKKHQRVDYRIFSGEVKTVPMRLEKTIEQKFFDQGFNRNEIKQYIKEHELIGYNNRIFYDDVKPILDYLEEHLKVHPGRILNQFATRYESGELITVPKAVYELALRLKEKARDILESGSKYEFEKLREEIYGKRTGLTLFSAVEDELAFLKTHGERSPKHYLGRSISLYKTSKLKRIAAWRAQKIKYDCYKLIVNNPEIPISSIPKSFSNMIFTQLLSTLTGGIISMLVEDKSGQFEKSILKPTFLHKENYRREKQKMTSMDEAAHVLGMSKRAFDLMVASHRDIFRSICIHEQKWHIPDAYLDEILRRDRFYFIKAKYEYLAEDGKKTFMPIIGEGRSSDGSDKTLSQQTVSRHHWDVSKRERHARSHHASLWNNSPLERQGLSRVIDSTLLEEDTTSCIPPHCVS